uniref:Prolyl endopeptidase n=1 Tax=Callorhinchus milii TaxID=7868 RepID=V9KDK7_CALMI
MPRLAVLLQRAKLGIYQPISFSALLSIRRWNLPKRRPLNSSVRTVSCLMKGYRRAEVERSGLMTRSFNNQVQEILQSELEYYKSKSHEYRELEVKLKKRLEATFNKYISTNDSPKILQIADTVYYEDGGCIYRCRIPNGVRLPEVVLRLDELRFLRPKDADFQRIRVSPGQKYLACGVRTSREEASFCVVVRLGARPEVAHVLPGVFSFEWGTDDVLFYTIAEKLKSQQVFRLLLASNAVTPEVVYREKDPRFFVEVISTKDGRFVTVNSNSKSSSEVWLIDCSQPLGQLQIVQERVPGIIYHVEHWGNQLYILTNWGATKEYQLVKTPLSSPGIESWQTVSAVRERAKLVDMELLEDHCVMLLKCRGRLHMDVFSLREPESVKSVQLPAWACTIETEASLKHKANEFSFQLSSPVQPPISFVYSVEDDGLYIQEDETGSNVISDYNVKRLEVPSEDGTLVPVTVFQRRSPKPLRERPLLVQVYGAYGMDLNLGFEPEQMVLLEDDWVLAYCHVRGGGELGLNWHEAGRLDRKHKGAEDLWAGVSHLHTMGYSKPRLTALAANSAGGVLAGALCNTYPHLIRAVLLRAPFLDVLDTMLDPSLPLTIEEQEEWGDPLTDRNLLEYIKSYCPYQNIKPQRYPSMFITAYQDDQRVLLGSVLRYVSKLRNAVAVDSHEHNARDEGELPGILLDIQPGGAHFGSTDWEESIREVARHYAFLYKALGLDV